MLNLLAISACAYACIFCMRPCHDEEANSGARGGGACGLKWFTLKPGLEEEAYAQPSPVRRAMVYFGELAPMYRVSLSTQDRKKFKTWIIIVLKMVELLILIILLSLLIAQTNSNTIRAGWINILVRIRMIHYMPVNIDYCESAWNVCIYMDVLMYCFWNN